MEKMNQELKNNLIDFTSEFFGLQVLNVIEETPRTICVFMQTSVGVKLNAMVTKAYKCVWIKVNYYNGTVTTRKEYTIDDSVYFDFVTSWPSAPEGNKTAASVIVEEKQEVSRVVVQLDTSKVYEFDNISNLFNFIDNLKFEFR